MTDVSPPPCVVCGSGTRRVFNVENCWIRFCVECGHERAEPIPGDGHAKQTYGDMYFFGGGTFVIRRVYPGSQRASGLHFGL